MTALRAADRIGRRPGIVRRVVAATASAAMLLTAAAPAVFAQGLTISTPYPAIVVAPGADVSFDVNVETTAPERVALTLTGAPDSWEAAIHGGGFVIDAVETNGTDPTEIRVDMVVPTDASGTTSMTLTGRTSTQTIDLLLEVRVDAEATGAITVTNDIPALRGPSTQTFTFNLTVRNDTTEDQSYSATGAGPTGWTVNTTLTGQSQAASAIVDAGSTAGITVSVEPPTDVAAGTYTMQVATSVAGQTLVNDLQVEITGSYELTIETPEGTPLNGRGSAGAATPLTLVVTNTGTAAVTNVSLSASAPSGWEVTFAEETIASLEPNVPTTVNATVTPSGDAIAGDYELTITAAGDQSTRDSVDIRYTVETSLLWGVIGVALILAVAGGIWWVFQRYGRR